MRYIDCVGCKQTVYVTLSDFRHVEDGDIHIDYLICPRCGKKYVCFASDVPMRELVTRRGAIREKLKVARAKKFREKTIESYIRENDRIKAEQKKMLPALMERANAVLADEDDNGGKDDERKTVEA